MKKVLAFLLVAILVVTASVCVAFAAPSKEAQGVISGIGAIDANENAATISVEKIDGKVNKDFHDTLTGLKDEEDDKTLKVVGQYELKVEGDAEYPLTVTLDVLGISKSSSVYVLVKKGDDVVAVTAEVKNGKVIFELDDEADEIAIVADGKTATKVEKENDVLSPQTGDVTVYVAFIALAAFAGLVLISKKVKA